MFKPVPVLEVFGAFVKEARLAKGITQLELAEAMEVKQNTVSAWERGKCGSAFDTLDRLFLALEVDTFRAFKRMMEIAKAKQTRRDAVAATIVDESTSEATVLRRESPAANGKSDGRRGPRRRPGDAPAKSS